MGTKILAQVGDECFCRSVEKAKAQGEDAVEDRMYFVISLRIRSVVLLVKSVRVAVERNSDNFCCFLLGDSILISPDWDCEKGGWLMVELDEDVDQGRVPCRKAQVGDMHMTRPPG